MPQNYYKNLHKQKIAIYQIPAGAQFVEMDITITCDTIDQI